MKDKDANTSNEEPHVSNEQILEYLRFYTDMKGSPGYAILLNGEWGSGKTWFIKKFRADQETKQNQQFLYVSLYGVTSSAEIEDQFFQQLHPVLSHKALTVGTKIVRDTLKAAMKIDLTAASELKKILEKAENCILIFDDLERCKMRPEEILGYINTFVEHHGRKVIILAHEGEIESSAEFKKKNEKLIGRRFSINSEFESALSFFLGELDNLEVKKILEKNAALITSLYKSANYKNLRTLRQSVIEYQRLFALLPDKARKHDNFQSDCIKTVFNVCIEIKSGRILPKDLKDLREHQTKIAVEKSLSKRNKNTTREDEVDTTSPLEVSIDRIFGNSFLGLIPNESFLYYFFEFGTVPNLVVNSAVDGCQYFFDADTPAWMRLWRIWDLNESEFEQLFKSVFDDFYAYKFVIQGELKHVAAILIHLARNRIIATTLKATVNSINQTIDHMIANSLIEVEKEDHIGPRFDDAFRGLAFTEARCDEFQFILKKIRKYQDQRVADAIQKESLSLTDMMISDPKGFLHKLTLSNSNSSRFYRLPVLKNLSIDQFLDSYLKMEPGERTNIYYLFTERYKYGGEFTLPLTQELPWLKKLQSALKAKAKTLKQPTRFHMEHLEREGVAVAIKMLASHKKVSKPAKQAVDDGN